MSTAIQAQTLDVHRFEPATVPAVLPQVLQNESDIQSSSEQQNQSIQNEALTQISGTELSQHPAVMAQLISQAIQQQQWPLVELLIPAYEEHADADPYLVLYAKGALYRHKQNYYMAIGAFKALLYLDPALSYVQLDLAVMQIEDKRYAEAMSTLEALLKQPETPTAVREIASRYIDSLQKLYSPNVEFSLSYTRNDNVNQASAERTLELWGATFEKNPDSLPKSGHGVSYGVNVTKLTALHGNHSLWLGLQYRGMYYWDQKDYNERVLRLAPAYLYQSHHQWLRIGPVYEKTWLGSQQYGDRFGVQAEYGLQVIPQHYVIPTLEYAYKNYDDSRLRPYEGNAYSAGLSWVYQPRAGVSLSAGAYYQQDHLRDKAESSRTISARLGGSYRWVNGLNVQANLQVGRRHFDAPHFLFNDVRKDREAGVSFGLWHSKFSVMGITPKLVYRYNRVNSNMPALYSRTSKGFMLEIVDMAF
ncbi:surface lipoprotein assembly modifier [Paenalcaligenes sp. Me131]|uniref:surface lipoprotein assembly modifier n=1 Tax=Paenalcaligenes sp. Me131 TaxID=3392636 RepID=UPI003D2E98D2